MRFGLSFPIHGPFSDPHLHVELAVEAEKAGWDGYFVWDHITWQTFGRNAPLTDPWIVLAAIATRTQRMRLGPMVTPLARRRPWKVVRETVALDHLSQGRMILGVGLGAFPKAEFQSFGEEGDNRMRGRKLDEALDVLTGLWCGEPFHYDGKYYQVEGAHFMPTPIQQPRIPIWIAGTWRPNQKRRPFRRAARFDGTFPFVVQRQATPDDFQAIRAYIGQHRTDDSAFDVVCARPLQADEWESSKTVAQFAAAGVTWWMMGATPSKLRVEQVRAQIQQGPPTM